jgi:DNA-binding NarL/FixJ family response regulator
VDKKLSVIVADDDTLSVRGLLSELRRIQNIDPEIPQPRNGKEVLALCENKKYDFIFLDYLMPKMDGLQTAVAMKEAGIDTHVIFHSEVASKEDIKKILSMGYHVWIEKNCNYLNVQFALKAAVEGKPFLPDKINALLLEQIISDAGKSNTNIKSQLTKTEAEILLEMIKGIPSQEIARKRNVSVSTVNSHRHNIHEKTQEDTVYGLMCYAIEQKFINPRDFFERVK